MKSNKLIPVVGACVLALALIVILLKRPKPPERADVLTDYPVAPGADADSPADTVRSLSAQVSDMLATQEALMAENERLRKQSEAAHEARLTFKDEVERAAAENRRQTEAHSADFKAEAEDYFRELASRFDEKMASLEMLTPSKRPPAPDRPPDADAGFRQPTDAPTATAGPEDEADLRDFGFELRDIPQEREAARFGRVAAPGGARNIAWASAITSRAVRGEDPETGRPMYTAPGPNGDQIVMTEDEYWASLPPPESRRLEALEAVENDTADIVAAVHGDPAAAGSARAAVVTTPVLTIPANSTLLNATLFTSMLGRVPRARQDIDRLFPFKILVGSDNLAANGHYIPGLRGIVFSGVAEGDWNMSCASGVIDSGLYIFEDGRQVTFGETAGASAQAGAGSAVSGGESIGWISDPRGVPCVKGVRVSNAHKQLIMNVLLAGATGFAEAFSQAETTKTVDASGETSNEVVTGDAGRYAAGKTASTSLGSVTQWLLERQRRVMDAIFVHSGRKLAVHITTDLHIDYNEYQRMLDYAVTAAAYGGGYGGLD